MACWGWQTGGIHVGLKGERSRGRHSMRNTLCVDLAPLGKIREGCSGRVHEWNGTAWGSEEEEVAGACACCRDFSGASTACQLLLARGSSHLHLLLQHFVVQVRALQLGILLSQHHLRKHQWGQGGKRQQSRTVSYWRRARHGSLGCYQVTRARAFNSLMGSLCSCSV